MWYYFVNFYEDGVLPQVYGPFMEAETRNREAEVCKREDPGSTVILVEVDPTDAELTLQYQE